jgi:hypothetical protein
LPVVEPAQIGRAVDGLEQHVDRDGTAWPGGPPRRGASSPPDGARRPPAANRPRVGCRP